VNALAKSLRRPLLLLAGLLAAFSASTATASAIPVLEVSGYHGPTTFEAGKGATYSFVIQNIGDEKLDVGYSNNGTPEDGEDDTLADPLTVDVQLPQGVSTRLDGPFFPFEGLQSVGALDPWDCSASPESITEAGHDSVRCTLRVDYDRTFKRGSLVPGRTVKLLVYVQVDDSASGSLDATATVEGGGAAPAVAIESAPVGVSSPSFGLAPGTFIADAFDRQGQPARQAGSHPYRAFATFGFNLVDKPIDYFNTGTPKPAGVPKGTLREVAVTLPRGLYGNPNAFPRCTYSQLANPGEDNLNGGSNSCPVDSQVGVLDLGLTALTGRQTPPPMLHLAVYNMVPPRGALADFAFEVVGRPVHIRAYLDPTDYSIRTVVPDINETLPVLFQRLNLWGVPADPVHDGDRWGPNAPCPELVPGITGRCSPGEPSMGFGNSSSAEPKPFLTLPSQCGAPDESELRVRSWEGDYDPPLGSPPYLSATTQLSGCNQVEFKPSVQVRPTTNIADAPSGLEFDLHMTQNEDPYGLATAPLRDAVVALPAGMTVNPPSADGLSSCSLAQIGMSAAGVPNGAQVTCPEASKIGSLEAISPPIDHPLKGAVYLAEQNANPFGSLLALYLAIEDPESGVLVKIPGKVEADPGTGQLTAIFRQNPQLPVEDLHLRFKEGPRAPLKTPPTCGTHTTTGTLTPWTSPEGADVPIASSFELVQGPGGRSCPGAGAGADNSPSFTAGSEDPTAKAFTPFVLKLGRADGTQQLKSIDATLPKGLLGKLAGTTYCPDAALSAAAARSGKDERANASCPSSSKVGTVNVGAGAGSTPLYVGGTVYLAGPYEGAPLSLAIITPAVAGPFDLGTVVERTKLEVNPENAQIHAVSDELPTILQGIPLNIRSITVKMDRPDFTLNPTSCDPTKVEGSALSVFNQSASLSSPFQVGECDKLGFKPDLKLKLQGGTKRSQFPALTATLAARPGDANIGKTVVALPRSEFLAQSHIRTICTRVQYAAEQCPPGSIYGKATAWSPLLDQPLSGPVYLRSSSNPLPDMVVALDGQIDVDLVGRIDSFNKGIRTTFDTVPDAPVSKFVLEMQGGKKGLLENSRNLCRTVNKATVEMTGQNGAAYDSTPALQSKCKQAKKKKTGAKKTGKKG
jgi:hypothetical protein